MLFSGLCFYRQNGIFGTNLGTDGTTGAQIGVNFDPFVPDIKGRASQRIHAGPVILAFIGYAERFVFGKFKGIGIQGAGFFGYDHRYAFIVDCLFDGIDTFLHLVGLDDGHVFNPDGSYNLFDGYPAIPLHVDPGHVNARIWLVTGHGSGAVIKNNQGEIVIIVNAIDQAGYS